MEINGGLLDEEQQEKFKKLLNMSSSKIKPTGFHCLLCNKTFTQFTGFKQGCPDCFPGGKAIWRITYVVDDYRTFYFEVEAKEKPKILSTFSIECDGVVICLGFCRIDEIKGPFSKNIEEHDTTLRYIDTFYTECTECKIKYDSDEYISDDSNKRKCEICNKPLCEDCFNFNEPYCEQCCSDNFDNLFQCKECEKVNFIENKDSEGCHYCNNCGSKLNIIERT